MQGSDKSREVLWQVIKIVKNEKHDMRNNTKRNAKLFISYFVLFAISGAIVTIISVRPLAWPSWRIVAFDLAVVILVSFATTLWHLYYIKKHKQK